MKIRATMYKDDWYPVYFMSPLEVWGTPVDMEYEDYLTGVIYDNLMLEANDYLCKLYGD